MGVVGESWVVVNSGDALIEKERVDERERA